MRHQTARQSHYRRQPFRTTVQQSVSDHRSPERPPIPTPAAGRRSSHARNLRPHAEGVRILTLARDLLTPTGVWQQGRYAACPDGCDRYPGDAAHFCLAGAIRRVSCHLVHGQAESVTEGRWYAFRILRGTLDEMPETNNRTSAEDVVIAANDRPDRDHGNIIAWLNRAIANPVVAPPNEGR